MAFSLRFLEECETESPSSAGFSIDGGRAVSSFQLENPTPLDLLDLVPFVDGATSFRPTNDGTLKRTPPLAHPLYNWLYAYAITSIRGVGRFTLVDAFDQGEVPTMPQFALYDNYRVTIEFRPRSYPIVLDEDIIQHDGMWYNDAGASQPFFYAPEWMRYTDFASPDPANNFVTAQQGSMWFITNVGVGIPSAGGKVFTGSPRMLMPDVTLKFILRQVPYRWITSPNAYIPRWRGRINQNTWNGYTPGTLLYQNYKPILYTPPAQDQVLNVFGTGFVFSAEKLCDIELTFMHTSRTSPDAPPQGGLKGALGNQNIITAGWNLLPWLNGDRLFHYAETKPTAINPQFSGAPSWPSFPLEILWTDPDSIPNNLPP